MASVATFGAKMNNFSWRLFSRVSENDPDRSPDTGVGAANVLSLLGGMSLAAEATGTKEAEALINGGNLDDMASQLTKLGEDRTCFKWFSTPLVIVPSGRPIKSDFIEKAKTNFGMEVRSSDLKAQGASRTVVTLINDIMMDKSEGHTAEMITPDYQLRPSDGYGVIAACTVYFHPWWNVRFDRSKTEEASFFETSARERRVTMMFREEVLPYTEGEVAPGVKVQVVGLACRRNAGMVYFVVPVKKFGLREVIGKASAESLAALMAACVPRTVSLSLPKLMMTGTTQLRGFLGEMGLRKWQSPSLDGIMDDKGKPLFINEVLHQTIVRFNEDGEMDETGDKPDAEATGSKVRCDHPFMFVFRHDSTGAFWLIGTSSRPIYPRKST